MRRKKYMVYKTLIEDLFIEMKETLKICTNRDYIVDLIFPYYLDYSGKSTKLSRAEIYNASRDDDFKKYSVYMLDENAQLTIGDEVKTLETIRKVAIEQFVNDCMSKGCTGHLKEILITLLNETNIHLNKELCKKMINVIERLQPIGKVRSEIEKRWFDEWINALYYYFYFAVTDKLHTDMAFSAYPELEKDLTEYNEKVTLMYGVSGNPGMYQLYSMAKRNVPNIIALYECGELEYYGKGPSGKVNYQKAYEFYEKTRECNSEHPLATWSIAYMKFCYSQEKAANNPEYRVTEFEEELCGGKRAYSWYDSILLNAQSSYNYGCAAAANLLGKIVDASDEEFPVSRRGIFKSVSSKKLYKESADGGYVYGCNNYANICVHEAEKSVNNEEKKQLYKEAMIYLEKSANLGNPWAANKVGLFYFNGIKIGNETIVERELDKAYKLFEYACIMTHAENYYWPFINICKFYWLNPESDKYMIVSKADICNEINNALINAKDREQLKELTSLLQRMDC